MAGQCFFSCCRARSMSGASHGERPRPTRPCSAATPSERTIRIRCDSGSSRRKAPKRLSPDDFADRMHGACKPREFRYKRPGCRAASLRWSSDSPPPKKPPRRTASPTSGVAAVAGVSRPVPGATRSLSAMRSFADRGNVTCQASGIGSRSCSTTGEGRTDAFDNSHNRRAIPVVRPQERQDAAAAARCKGRARPAASREIAAQSREQAARPPPRCRDLVSAGPATASPPDSAAN